MTERILLSWSGGKDSALALYEIQRTPGYAVAALLTTVTEAYDRISMHGVRRALLEKQAGSLNLPLEKVCIPPNATNGEYETRMRVILERHVREGVKSVAFGDIFLDDLKQYREKNLAQIGLKGLFPLWRKDPGELARTFIHLGFKAVVVSVDSKLLDHTFAGRLVDEDFLRQLPPQVDPCGENGEFHSFVFDGPIFNQRVEYTLGKVICRDSFWYRDLLP